MMNGNYSSGGGWALMMFGSLVLAVLIVGLFWYADRSSRRESSDRASPDATPILRANGSTNFAPRTTPVRTAAVVADIALYSLGGRGEREAQSSERTTRLTCWAGSLTARWWYRCFARRFIGWWVGV